MKNCSLKNELVISSEAEKCEAEKCEVEKCEFPYKSHFDFAQRDVKKEFNVFFFLF